MPPDLKATPFLKWAGGKKQLLPHLLPYVPDLYGTYIEPFVGGGALFFELRPRKAILSDLNPELINCYIAVRDSVDAVVDELRKRQYANAESAYYRIRSLDPSDLSPVERAARLIYLNKTGFNGLYRVNKRGEFNVPFGHRQNPQICDPDTLTAASEALQGAQLLPYDYKRALREYAKAGDFVYLDPPYYPAGGFAEFKRYTKEFFYEADHVELRDEAARLVTRGCYVLLTNSNTPFVRELYDGFEYHVIDARRSISSKAATRTGEDLIVIATGPKRKTKSQLAARGSRLLDNFPGTRYMGSKYRVLPFIWQSVQDLQFESVLDAFSGSGVVSYMFKQHGKQVTSNDFMHFAFHIAKATVENSSCQLSETDLAFLLAPSHSDSTFISDTFRGLYFSDVENAFLDSLRANISQLENEYKQSMALAAISRACMKRRARGVFTFVGSRYDDGRRDMQIDLKQHFVENVAAFNQAVFDNGKKNRALNLDVFEVESDADLIYLDPPYFTPHSDNDYSRRYHFVEGLVRNWMGLQIQYETTTKKFKRYRTPFSTKDSAFDAFEHLIDKFQDRILVVSYSSNSYPTKADLVTMLKRRKSQVRVHQIEHVYSFGNQGDRVGDNANRAQEFIFVAF